MGIGTVQGSYAVFAAAFLDPSDPREHTRLNARRHCWYSQAEKLEAAVEEGHSRPKHNLPAILSPIS